MRFARDSVKDAAEWGTMNMSHAAPDLDPAALREARLQAHWAVQWLARAARAYLPAKEDDSQTNLGWDAGARALTTHVFGGWTVALGLSPLTLTVNGGRSGPETLALAGLDDGAVGNWLAKRLSAGGFPSAGLSAPLPYAVPDHPIGTGGRYGGPKDADFPALAEWFALGAAAIRGSGAAFTAHGHSAPEPRCWPHHFDFATQVAFPGAGGQTAYVGAGYSPGDTFYEEPYFYVTLYPKASIDGLPSLAPIGRWRGDGFTGAVAPASDIVTTHDPQSSVAAFLAIAVGAASERLKR